jgi:pSer/pThr/pTyr-binding forkhead associated (FHA) protein
MATITLRILDGTDRGRSYDELPTPVTIGREEGNSIQLNDERVSRFHLKIQEDREKIVITDLESTNGTKVNGEDVQLRILRHGDLISVGRSVLLYGSREQIARRLAELRGEDLDNSHTLGASQSESSAKSDSSSKAESPDLDADWADNLEIRETLHSLEPPDLPQHLSPAQAAQMSELLEYLHNRIRALLESVKFKAPAERITLNFEQWQNLLDVQARLASYLRSIGDPHDPED